MIPNALIETHHPVIERKKEDQEIVLSVEGVSKKFCRSLKRSLFYGLQDIAGELARVKKNGTQLRSGEFWALGDVSFNLRRGEALGLIGPNGAGKTTLLRIICGLIKPTAGTVRLKGRVAPLIALGAGFNPVLTGRENIYVNMSILGLTKKEIDGKFQDVLDFAELGEVIEAPVQTYSSGMAARLGFACAVHTEPDILLIDEVLAVGDMKFRIKCYRWLAKLREKGTAFILVSHNPQSILSICDSAVYLREGKLLAEGDSPAVLQKYEEDLFLKGAEYSIGKMNLSPKEDAQSSGLDITALYFRDEEGNVLDSPVSGRPLLFCIKCKVRQRIDSVVLSLLIRDPAREGECVLSLSSDRDGKFFDMMPGEVEIRLYLPHCGLRLGFYYMKLWISRPPQWIYDVVESFPFQVRSDSPMSECSFHQPREWQIHSVGVLP